MSGVYIIPLNGLRERRYSYDYHVDNDLFREFENSEISDCDVNVVAHLGKSSSNFSITFEISGRILVTCDRCLGEYWQDITAENTLVVKRGEIFDDSDPDIMVIPAGHHELDLKQLLYDYIVLALPVRRVHPDEPGEANGCDPDVVAKIGGVAGEAAGNSSFDKLKELLNDN